MRVFSVQVDGTTLAWFLQSGHADEFVSQLQWEDAYCDCVIKEAEISTPGHTELA